MRLSLRRVSGALMLGAMLGVATETQPAGPAERYPETGLRVN
jgi:hypothetical protein